MEGGDDASRSKDGPSFLIPSRCWLAWSLVGVVAPVLPRHRPAHDPPPPPPPRRVTPHRVERRNGRKKVGGGKET